jgi:integrase
MKTFNEILVSFLAEIKIQLKPKSYSSYTGKTKVFSEWLSSKSLEGKPLSEITKHNISEFFIYLATDRALDKTTCQKYYINIKSVWKYAIKRGDANILPFDLITFPRKKEDKSAQVISPEHMKILLTKIKEKDPQLYLAWETQYYTCIRPGKELRLLKVGDINFESGTLLVTSEHAKTGKKRVVTIPTQLLDIYDRYEIKKENKGLFLFGRRHKPDNKPCSINMLRWRFNKIRDELGLPKEYKFYSAKHTSITRLHNSGAPLLSSMEHAGHTSIAAHQHYLHRHNTTVNESIRNNYPSPY